MSEIDKDLQALEDKKALQDVVAIGSNVPTGLELVDADSNCPVSIGKALENSAFTLFFLKRHYA